MTWLHSNTDKSIGELTDNIEREILDHSWQRAEMCPQCGNESDLRIGPEHESDRYVVVPECGLCDAVVAQLLGEIDP